ncbi:MAG: hypothetical protein JNJ50_28660 [Acidobacteria bacterium]|nr:hypothetical protein [Acidobacteriota bacterium]
MRFLNRTTIERAITMRAAVEIVRSAFQALSTGEANVPVRLSVAEPQHDGVTLFMPGYLPGSDALAIKIVSVHGRNPARQLPRINALVILIDPATGVPLAALEGGFLTALRTGAGSGVATDLLANPHAETAAIFGAGTQARTQLLAVAAVRQLKRCWIYAPRSERAEQMIAEMQPHLPAVELLAAASPALAVRDADVICAATNSHTPVFDGRDLKPGAHVNAVGSYQPHVQEIDAVTLQRASKIVVDQRAAALDEAGDLLIPLSQGVITLADIYGEIGEIAAGLKPGRERTEDITYFKSVGNAVQDVAVAHAIYRKALQENLGVEFDLLA